MTDVLIDEQPFVYPLYPEGQSAVADSSAGGGVLASSGNPEGVLTAPSSPAVAGDCATGGLYLYCGVAGGNTGWITLISP